VFPYSCSYGIPLCSHMCSPHVTQLSCRTSSIVYLVHWTLTYWWLTVRGSSLLSGTVIQSLSIHWNRLLRTSSVFRMPSYSTVRTHTDHLFMFTCTYHTDYRFIFYLLLSHRLSSYVHLHLSHRLSSYAHLLLSHRLSIYVYLLLFG